MSCPIIEMGQVFLFFRALRNYRKDECDEKRKNYPLQNLS